MNSIKARTYFFPFIFTIVVIFADQLSKVLILAFIDPWTVGYSFFNGFLRIVCVYNTGAAFSLGHNLSSILRSIFLLGIPLIFILAVIAMYFKAEFTNFQRWILCGIVGGGISNLIDRFIRSEGVVDFIDVKFFGLFGLERWPTFNIADSVIVVCAFMMFITVFISERNNKK